MLVRWCYIIIKRVLNDSLVFPLLSNFTSTFQSQRKGYVKKIFYKFYCLIKEGHMSQIMSARGRYIKYSGTTSTMFIKLNFNSRHSICKPISFPITAPSISTREQEERKVCEGTRTIEILSRWRNYVSAKHTNEKKESRAAVRYI